MGLLAPLLSLVVAAILSASLIPIIRPLLLRHALATPNGRSSHTNPTPQGAGIAVIGATLAVGGCAAALSTAVDTRTIAIVFGATIFIAIVGALDDLKPIPVLPRLIAHAIAVGVILAALPTESRILASSPLWLERILLLIAGIWFVNLVNFMDGLDWMTVAETVPITGALVLLGAIGSLPPTAALTAAALCGAMLGFAPFNRPVAKIFLGDVGSLPVGLLLGWALLELALYGHLIAALLLPLYYLADTTVTMLRRAFNGEQFWVAHRSHFYQRATDNGFTVLQVVGTVFVLNLFLVALAILTTVLSSITAQLLLLVAGALAVVATMYRFDRSRQAAVELRHRVD